MISAQTISNKIMDTFKLYTDYDLNYILDIIELSFAIDDIVDCYINNMYQTFSDIFVNTIEEYMTLIFDNNDIQKYSKYISIIKNTNINDCFNICKLIYDIYKNKNLLINTELKQIFSKYRPHDFIKNNDSYDMLVYDIMYRMVQDISKTIYQINNSISVLDPCIEHDSFFKLFMNNEYSNITLKGTNINKKLYIAVKYDLITNGYSDSYIYNNDFMSKDNDDLLKSDICLCYPPMYRSIFSYDPIQFLEKATTLSDICCCVLPESQFDIKDMIQNIENILNNSYVYSIIKLGHAALNNVCVGNVIIITAIRKNKYKTYIGKEYDKTLIFDLSKLSDEKYCKALPIKYSDLTIEGKRMIDEYNDYFKPTKTKKITNIHSFSI